MRYPFESPEAQEMNQKIFETIYYGALTVSSVKMLNFCWSFIGFVCLFVCFFFFGGGGG